LYACMILFVTLKLQNILFFDIKRSYSAVIIFLLFFIARKGIKSVYNNILIINYTYK
jgi:hypothetical protein